MNKLLLTLGLLIAPLLVISQPVYAAEPSDAACFGLKSTGATVSCDDEGTAKDNVNDIAVTIINIFSIVVGAVSVIMIIIGGFRYVVSGGDSNGVQGAKNTILYALVGLIVVLFSQAIVIFVLSNANTSTVEEPPAVEEAE